LAGPLIGPDELADGLARTPDSRPIVLDVRWELTGARHQDYLAGHIPGAAFVDLDRALAEPPGPGGRHPLPSSERFARAMRRAGVREAAPVVAYDAATSLAAARAWWLLRYYGHEDVRVLDGGLAAWMAAGYSLQTGPTAVDPGDFAAIPGGMPLLDASSASELSDGGLLLDARAPDRFRGDHEPIDPVAGHIPGARNRPTTENLDAHGRFLSAGDLRRAFEQAGAGDDVSVGAYCGSGVTAAHEVLALEVAGFPAALYVGSWSDWVTDPSRPVATGG
jgi:thiosulfate/3-mercaptopyruvate sulfurtransferase